MNKVVKYTFSGHESFPCKTLWLKKGYDFVKAEKDFNAAEAVVDLGVGKNMVSAIRYWFKAFGLNCDSETNWIADYILNSDTGDIVPKVLVSESGCSKLMCSKAI